MRWLYYVGNIRNSYLCPGVAIWFLGHFDKRDNDESCCSRPSTTRFQRWSHCFLLLLLLLLRTQQSPATVIFVVERRRRRRRRRKERKRKEKGKNVHTSFIRSAAGKRKRSWTDKSGRNQNHREVARPEKRVLALESTEADTGVPFRDKPLIEN